MTTISRRKFLALGASTGAIAASGYLLFDRNHQLITKIDTTTNSITPTNHDVLVIFTLYGGNDGLNTIVPFTDPLYAKLRGSLALTQSDVTPLGKDDLYINNSLANLTKLWNQDKVAIVAGVSYPNPILSHFVSMDIWQSGSTDNSIETGWIGRYLDQLKSPTPTTAISIGTSVPPLAIGASTSASSLVSTTPNPLPRLLDGQALTVLGNQSKYQGMDSIYASSISDLLTLDSDLTHLFAGDATKTPTTSLGTISNRAGGGASSYSAGASKDAATIATLINAGIDTRVFTFSMSGFDTHVNEAATHKADLKAADEAIASLFSNLTDTNRGRVTLLVYSEFGRRANVNGGGGTDHGTASVAFVVGDMVKGGIYGQYPSLSSLIDDNLKVTTDFRSIYAPLIDTVLQGDSKTALYGSYPNLTFV